MTAKNDAIRILDTHRIMAISTLRPDGWPQTTIVGYANIGLIVYFLIFRSSQKFANIKRDNRVSIAIGEEPRDLAELNAVYAGAHASEVTVPGEREDAWRLLMQRHLNLASFQLPEPSEAAVMRAECKYVSMLDYRIAPGHHQALTIDSDGATATENHETDAWGSRAAQKDAKAQSRADRV